MQKEMQSVIAQQQQRIANPCPANELTAHGGLYD